MKQLHKQEKEQFKALFRQEKIDRFEERFTVLEVFLQSEGHITADELVESLEGNGHRFAADFVKDTLTLMCQFGFARKNRFNNGQVRYEHRHMGQHHDHMICTKCGNIIEFTNDQLETLQTQIASSHGFHMLWHKMEIYGICEQCLKERIVAMQLAAAKPGERLIIKGLSGGAGARMRLMSMGLRVGDEIEVISNLNQGQIVAALENKRYVLGRGLAQKIQVERSADPVVAKQPPLLPSSEPVLMSQMIEGQKGTISRVGGNGALRRRLLEMGLLKGTEIYIEKYAPLKDPLELIVKGYHISLRVEEAAQITVNDVR